MERVIVTCGAAGAWTLDAGGHKDGVAGGKVDRLVDPVGAGDAFAAVYMLGLLRGWTAADTLARADALARGVCGLRGAVPDSVDFYRPFMAASVCGPPLPAHPVLPAADGGAGSQDFWHGLDNLGHQCGGRDQHQPRDAGDRSGSITLRAGFAFG